MSKAKIQIRMLGNFEILVDGNEVLPHLKQSKKTSLFLEYLLLHCGKAVSHMELMDALWAEQERANPGTALRTLLHRYRQLVQQSGIDALADSVISTRGFIQWNTALDCEVDTIEMERLWSKAQQADLPAGERIDMLNKALNLYRGPLLSNSAGELWVVPQRVHYHDLFLESVLLLVELLKREEDYNAIVQVCRKALTVDLYDERLHMELMLALVKTGKKREALSQYQFTTDLHYQQLGVQPSEDIRNLYKVIIHADQAMEKDIEIIQESIEHEDDSSCAFVCEYEIFKEIYHLQRRMLERYNSTIFLGLITLAPAYGQTLNPLVLDNAMKLLLEVLRTNLRRGDAVSRFSSMQYVTLLPAVTYESGKQVMERIKQQFYKKYVQPSIIMTYKLRPLCVDRFYSGSGQSKDAK